MSALKRGACTVDWMHHVRQCGCTRIHLLRVSLRGNLYHTLLSMPIRLRSNPTCVLRLDVVCGQCKMAAREVAAEAVVRNVELGVLGLRVNGALDSSSDFVNGLCPRISSRTTGRRNAPARRSTTPPRIERTARPSHDDKLAFAFNILTTLLRCPSPTSVPGTRPRR